MRDPEELVILTGLLDFYSDRATAHASFVVATTFGIYAVLFGGRNILPQWLFAIVYLALVLIGAYSFFNFGVYATLAEIVREKLMGEHCEEYEKEMKSELKHRYRLYYKFREFKMRHLYRSRKVLFLLGIWVSAVILPFVWILFSSW